MSFLTLSLTFPSARQFPLHRNHGHGRLFPDSGHGIVPVVCGLRNKSRKSMWRSSDLLSTESIQAVQSLKLAKSTHGLRRVLDTRLSRLLKSDIVNAFAELRRQNEVHLALEVFKYMCKEYGPDLQLYCDIIQLYGKNKMIGPAKEIFSEIRKEGMELDTRVYTEMIGAYLRADMISNAMETYEEMKASGCAPNELTLTILIRNLEQAGEGKLLECVRKDCEEYLDSPKKFLEEVERKFISLDPSSLQQFQ